MDIRSPALRRYLDEPISSGTIDPPRELVPAACFSGTQAATNTFSFYGETFSLGTDVNWDRNPGSSHWAHDLNRFGFLVLYDPANPNETLAMNGLILDWVLKNDRLSYKYTPYAWQNLLNVAIRIENWWRFLTAQKKSHGLKTSPIYSRRVKLSIFRQLIILLRLIRKRGFADNWSLIGLRSALYILCASAKFPHRERLIGIVWEDVQRAVAEQILPDGVQQELSPHYHWVALELLWSMRNMAAQDGRSEWRQLDPTIEAMQRLLEALMLPDGGLVSLGDSDLDDGPRIKSFLKMLRGGELPTPAGMHVSLFPYAGIAVVRDDARGHLLALDAGPFGTGHQHEDALSFWLTAHGENLLVDPGRYLYDQDPESLYAYLRSTAAHSTILIDGHGQNARANPSKWRRSSPDWPQRTDCGAQVFLHGRYEDGYGPDRIRVVHDRTIECDCAAGRWLIRDQLTGEGEHLIEARFQFAPCRWTLGPEEMLVERNGVALRLRFGGAWTTRHVLEGSVAPRGGWFSSGLNRIVPAPCLCLSGRFRLPFAVETEIVAERVAV